MLAELSFRFPELTAAANSAHSIQALRPSPSTFIHTQRVRRLLAQARRSSLSARAEALVDGKPVLEAAFRGRLLRGVSLPLPDGCTGSVLAREPRGGVWQATSSFSALTAWNHDTTPGSADAGPRLMQWLQVATALATPVSPEEVDARRTKAAGAQ